MKRVVEGMTFLLFFVIVTDAYAQGHGMMGLGAGIKEHFTKS